MTKRLQQDSGEERVTAKSKSMMNLSAKMSSFVSFSTSVNPGRDVTENRTFEDPLLQMIDQDNLINSLQQIIQNRIMTVLGLFKSGKVRLRHTTDQSNMIKLLEI